MKQNADMSFQVSRELKFMLSTAAVFIKPLAFVSTAVNIADAAVGWFGEWSMTQPSPNPADIFGPRALNRGTTSSKPFISGDPNDISGPAGYGLQKLRLD